MKSRLVMQFNKVKEELEKKGRLHYTDVAFILDVDVSRASILCKMFTRLSDEVGYEKGYLYLKV